MLSTCAPSSLLVIITGLSCGNKCVGFNVLDRSMQLDSQLIPMHEDAGLGLEESINVFEGPISSLRIEEVCDRNERETDNSPNNPELVAEVLNAR